MQNSAVKSLPILLFASLLSYETAIYAGEIDKLEAQAIQQKEQADEATRKANAAAAQKDEAARKAKAAEKAVQDVKAEADHRNKTEASRIAGLQRKCEKNGGDWKRGKCVMPPLPKPQSAPTVVEQPATASNSISFLVSERINSKMKCIQERGEWEDGMDQSTIGRCTKIRNSITSPSNEASNPTLRVKSAEQLSSTIMCGNAARNYPANDMSYGADAVFCDMGVAIPSVPNFPDTGTTISWICREQDENDVTCYARRF